jgi:hypothetical protein
LRYYSDPLEGTTEMPHEPGIYVLAALEHSVLFTFNDGVIRVLVVKPD